MKKSILFKYILSLLLFLSLTACGKKDSAAPADSPAQQKEDTSQTEVSPESEEATEPEVEELTVQEDFEVELEEGEALGGG